MNILITGIHGFVGSNLVKALAGGNTIYGLDIVAPEKVGVEKTYSWDDLSLPDFPAIDAIIHLAGKAHDTRNKSAADVYFKVNTGLTKKIFDWYQANPTAKKFVFFSTAKAAAERVPENSLGVRGESLEKGDRSFEYGVPVLKEDVTPTPVGPYGESKIQAEDYLLGLLEGQGVSRGSMASTVPGKDRPANGKVVYIFRPCMIHGPGNKGNLNLLYGVVSKGIPWPLGAYENRRTFTSIENMCFAVNGVLTKDVPSGIYNMGDDEALSTNELIEVICGVLGKKAHIWHIPCGLMNGVARVGGWLHLPLNPLRMQKLTENYVSSNAKIKMALGIDRFPVEARDGLKRTIECFAEGK